MGSASQQELEIRQDAMTPNDAAHSTNLYYIPSLLTDGEALDVVQNSLVSNGMEVWRGDALPGSEECCKQPCFRDGTSLAQT